MLAQHCNCSCSSGCLSPVKCHPAPPGSKVMDGYLTIWEMSYLQAAECRGHPVQGVKGMYLDNETGEHAVSPGAAAHTSLGAFVHCWEPIEWGCTQTGAARGGRARKCNWKSLQGGTFPLLCTHNGNFLQSRGKFLLFHRASSSKCGESKY